VIEKKGHKKILAGRWKSGNLQGSQASGCVYTIIGQLQVLLPSETGYLLRFDLPGWP